MLSKSTYPVQVPIPKHDSRDKNFQKSLVRVPKTQVSLNNRQQFLMQPGNFTLFVFNDASLVHMPAHMPDNQKSV